MVSPSVTVPGLAKPKTLYLPEYTMACAKLYPGLIWAAYSQPGFYLELKRPLLDYTRIYLYPGILWRGQFIPHGILWSDGVWFSL